MVIVKTFTLYNTEDNFSIHERVKLRLFALNYKILLNK